MGIAEDMVDRVETIRSTFVLNEYEFKFIQKMYEMTQIYGTDFEMTVKQINMIQSIWMDGIGEGITFDG